NFPGYLCYKRNMLMRPRNQGLCAACWSFSIVDMMADTVNLRTQGAWGAEPLSPQFLLDCWGGHSGCSIGAAPENVYDLPQVTSRGVPRERDYRYKEKVGWSCRKLPEGAAKLRLISGTAIDVCEPLDGLEGRELAAAVRRNVTAMKVQLLRRGPFVGTIRVHENIYANKGREGYAGGEGTPVSGWHACLVVGYCDAGVHWDRGFSQGHWILKNSWSKDFGDEGYFYVAMGRNCVDVESRGSWAQVEIPDELKCKDSEVNLRTARYEDLADLLNAA
ncbi:unnamed protein product, partial [Chrysoparadoxa australica]